jgi:hypothetical protein
MEFKTLAILVLTVIVLIILVLLAISVSGVLGEQVTNASQLLRL